MLRRILEAIRGIASALAEMTGQIFDFHLALTRHWTARLRRRFINENSPVFSFADERDFARFCRELKNPTEDPMLRPLEEDAEWLRDVECFRC